MSLHKWDCDSKYGLYTKTGTNEQVNEFRDSVSLISSVLGTRKRPTYDYIFELGLQTALERIEENGKTPQPGDKDYEDWLLYLEAAKRNKRQKRFNEYREIELDEGLDYLIEWANENQIDIADYLENRERFARQIAGEKREQEHPIDTWLMRNLADGKPHSTKELQKQAANDGLGHIAWNTVTQRAVRLHLTKAYNDGLQEGYWLWNNAPGEDRDTGLLL